MHETAIVEEGAEIGEGTKVWHFAHIRKGAVIGKHCNIGKGVYIDAGARIGDRVKIQNFVSIYKGVTIGDDVFIGPSVTFTNDLHPRAWMWDDSRLARTTIGKGASIGANSTILAGHTIGEYAMIGAGSVVADDVEPYTLMYGDKAVKRGYVNKNGDRR